MEAVSQNINPVNQVDQAKAFCPVCHQPILPAYYFCPNCGAKINTAPLSISPGTQAWIYAFSAVLPFTGFIFIKWWPGVKYYKSQDQKTSLVGQIAWTILIISTIATIWFAYVGTQQLIQSSVNSVNTDFSGL